MYCVVVLFMRRSKYLFLTLSLSPMTICVGCVNVFVFNFFQFVLIHLRERLSLAIGRAYTERLISGVYDRCLDLNARAQSSVMHILTHTHTQMHKYHY